MATTRIKDLTNTATTVASDEYLAVDGTTNGTSKITRDNFRTDTAAAFVAAPGTYNLAPLSGGAVPIDKGGTAATTAAGARTSLDVPSNSEAVLVANNLSDVTAATARTNLSVNSVDEDAEATATKLVGPAMYFDGSSSVVTVADDAKFSFTDGSDDLPFSISAWVKISDATSSTIISKFGAGAGSREWVLYLNGSDNLSLLLIDSSGNQEGVNSDAALTSYEGQFVHIAACYGGSGPNSASSFVNASSEITLYVNGVAVATSENSSGAYTGMINTSKAVTIGERNSSDYFDGHIKDVKIFNRELSAAEVAQLARGTDLGFSDEWGGANGGVYTSDFSVNSDSHTNTNGTVAGNQDGIGGVDDTMTFTTSAGSAAHYATRNVSLSSGKKYRVSFDFYIPSGQSNVDGIRLSTSSGSVQVINEASPTLGAWNTVSAEFTNDTSTGYNIYPLDGGAVTFDDTGGDDYFAVKNIKVTEIGTLADFRAERFDSSTDKLYDLANGFIGTNSGATLVGREVPVYESAGTFTPTLTFGGGSTGMTFAEQGGFYTRIGDTVFVRGIVFLSAKGSSTGSAKLGGLPFTASAAGSASSVVSVYASSMAALTSSIVGLVDDGGTGITLSDTGATGATDLDETNFGNSSIVRFSATYQIQ